MLLARWLEKLLIDRFSTRNARAGRSIGHVIEGLEDRTMLSALTVSTGDDNTTADAFLSLREAIAIVNHGGDASAALGRGLTVQESLRINSSEPFGTNDTIRFISQLAGSSINLQSQGAGSRHLEMTRDVQLFGPDTDPLIIDGRDASQILRLDGAINVSIRGLTFTGGTGVTGGAIEVNQARLELRTVTISDNTATASGGGIYNNAGTLLVFDSTISDNMAVHGGGVASSNGITVITNTTISGNSAMAFGGGVNSSGPLTIVNSTLAFNAADSNANQTGRGGGLAVAANSNAQLLNTIVAGNLRSNGTLDDDIHGSVQASSSHNLIGAPTSSGGLINGSNSNQVGDDFGGLRDIATVLDASLHDNGGPTSTHALRLGSPAVNMGSNLAAASTGLVFDQRGDGFSRIVQGAVDIGAYEQQILAELSIAPVGSGEQAEGNPGDGNQFLFTVSRSVNVLGETSVDYFVTSSEASAADFSQGLFPTGTVTFQTGETQKTISIPVSGDANVEADERFFVTLSDPSPGSEIVTGLAEATIVNDDSANVTIGNATVMEGGSLQFLVTLDSDVDGGLNVNFRTVQDTAKDGSSNQPDYVFATGTLNFLGVAGEHRTIVVPTLADNRVENHEAMLVELFGLNTTRGGVPGGSGIIQTNISATGTIEDNDDVNLEFAAINVSRSEGTGGQTTDFTFAVTLPREVDGGFSLAYSTDDGTATTAGGDYIDNDGTLNFIGVAGERKFITVQVVQDDTVELDESFFVSLGAISSTSITTTKFNVPNFSLEGRIFNDDAATVSIDDVTQDEDNGTMTFVVELDHPVDVPITAGVTSIHETTTAADFSLTQNSVTIAPGSLSGTVTVEVAEDEIVELDERFLLELINLQSVGRPVMFGDRRGLGTIRNDETARIAIQNGSSDEDDGVLSLMVTSDHAIDVAIPMTYTTVVNTASVGDFTPTVSTSILSAGQTETMISIPLTVDGIVELDEQFFVDLLSLQSSGRDVILDVVRGTGSILNDDSALLSIEDSIGSENAEAIAFTIRLDHPVDADVQVAFATETDTATTADFVARTGVATIPQGSTTATISIEPISDGLVEPDEQFFVRLSNVSASGRNVTLGNDRGVGTIKDDDVAAISIQDATQDEDAGTISFSLMLDRLIDADVTVDFATATGSAIATDFVATNGTATFAAGTNSTTITVPLTADTVVELDERFFVNLSNVQSGERNVILADSQAVGTIRNDDQAELSILDASQSEDDGPLRLTVSLDQPIDTDIKVDFATLFDEADNQDFTATTGTVTIPAGSTTAIFEVALTSDAIVELDEQFLIELLNLQPSGRTVTLVDSQAVGIILNDDAAIISVDDVLQEESAGSLTFTISISNTVDVDVLVDYATVADSANSSDFTAVSGTATITAGNSFTTVTVPLNDDGVMEFDEQFFLNLSNPAAEGRAVSIGDNQAIGTILGAGADARLSIADVTQDEDDGPMTFTVSLDNTIDEDVTVNLATMFGSAIANDFEAETGTAMIPAGQQSTTITIAITPDNFSEADEQFTLNLSQIQAGSRAVTFADAQATGTILNDDIAMITINDVTQNEDDGPIDFTVSVDQALDRDIQVDFSTQPDTAIIGDFLSTTGTLTIPAGTTSAAISVDVVTDDVVELAERFFVRLTNARATNRAVAIANSQGVATIQNDDQATLAVSDANATEDSGVLRFDVTLSSPVDTAIEFDFATVADTALTSDFVSNSGTVRIDAGDTSATIQVALQTDLLVEADERLILQLSNLVTFGRNVVWLDNQGVGTIVNDDVAAISIVDQSTDEDSGSMNFTVVLDQPVDVDVTFDFSTAAGPAGTNDFSATTGTATIVAGQTTTSLSIDILSDNIVELDEDFFVQLANLQASGRSVVFLDDIARGEIQNDDAASLTISDVVAVEGTHGSRLFQFAVVLDAAVDSTFQVDFATLGDTATATDGDYVIPTEATLTFAGMMGERQIINVEVVGDDVREPDEAFFVLLSNLQTDGRQITLANSQAQGIIRNDDLAPNLAVIEDQRIANGMINGSFREVVSGNFDNIANSDHDDDLLFWDPLSGANRIVFGNGMFQDNPISRGAVNGNDFTHILAGKFNSQLGTDLFLWNPQTGRNRLIHMSAIEAGSVSTTIQTNVIAPSAINGNDFQTYVGGNFDNGGLEDLFFWNPSSGKNRIAHLQVGTSSTNTVANIQTNVVEPTVINGVYDSVHVGQFIADGTDELLFLNLQSGQNRLVSFIAETAGQSTQFDEFQSSFLPPTAFNGSAYQQIEIGDFNGDEIDDVFAWDPTSGANRTALTNLSAGSPPTIVDGVVNAGAINGEYERVVRLTEELFSSPDTDELFFWNPRTGRNRIAAIEPL